MMFHVSKSFVDKAMDQDEKKANALGLREIPHTVCILLFIYYFFFLRDFIFKILFFIFYSPLQLIGYTDFVDGRTSISE